MFLAACRVLVVMKSRVFLFLWWSQGSGLRVGSCAAEGVADGDTASFIFFS